MGRACGREPALMRSGGTLPIPRVVREARDPRHRVRLRAAAGQPPRVRPSRSGSRSIELGRRSARALYEDLGAGVAGGAGRGAAGRRTARRVPRPHGLRRPGRRRVPGRRSSGYRRATTAEYLWPAAARLRAASSRSLPLGDLVGRRGLLARGPLRRPTTRGAGLGRALDGGGHRARPRARLPPRGAGRQYGEPRCDALSTGRLASRPARPVARTSDAQAALRTRRGRALPGHSVRLARTSSRWRRCRSRCDASICGRSRCGPA